MSSALLAGCTHTYFSRVNSIHIPHVPMESNCMPSIVSHNPLKKEIKLKEAIKILWKKRAFSLLPGIWGKDSLEEIASWSTVNNVKLIKSHSRKWFEPRSYVLWWNWIIRVKGDLRRTVGGDRCFNILNRCHLQNHFEVYSPWYVILYY